MPTNSSFLICLVSICCLASACADERAGVVDQVLKYGADVDLRQEAKRLSVSSRTKDRITAAAIVYEYPISFDSATAVSVLIRLLADKSDLVKEDTLSAVRRLTNLPPGFDVGEPATLRLFVPEIERIVNSGGPLRDDATETLAALRRKTEKGREIAKPVKRP